MFIHMRWIISNRSLPPLVRADVLRGFTKSLLNLHYARVILFEPLAPLRAGFGWVELGGGVSISKGKLSNLLFQSWLTLLKHN